MKNYKLKKNKMPKIGNKKFPYSAKGRAAAKRVKSGGAKSALKGLNADTARGSLYRKQGLARPGETNAQLARRGKTPTLRPRVGRKMKKLMGFKK